MVKTRKHPLTAAQRIDRTNNAQRLAAAKRIEYLEVCVQVWKTRYTAMVEQYSGSLAKIARLEQETRNWSNAYREQKIELTREIFAAKGKV